MSVRHKAARELVAAMLKAGHTVTPKALLEQIDLTIPEHAAVRMWLTNFTRSLTHDVAHELGFVVMSVGAGQYKRVDTPEEAEEAKRRAEVQIKGQARRRKVMKLKAALKNQRVLDLEEVKPDAGAAGADDKPESESA